jgi:hypothetical protein
MRNTLLKHMYDAIKPFTGKGSPSYRDWRGDMLKYLMANLQCAPDALPEGYELARAAISTKLAGEAKTWFDSILADVYSQNSRVPTFEALLHVMDAHYGPSTMPLKARAALKSFRINQQEDMQSQISQLYVLFEEAGMPETERLVTLISALEDHPPARQSVLAAEWSAKQQGYHFDYWTASAALVHQFPMQGMPKPSTPAAAASTPAVLAAMQDASPAPLSLSPVQSPSALADQQDTTANLLRMGDNRGGYDRGRSGTYQSGGYDRGRTFRPQGRQRSRSPSRGRSRSRDPRQSRDWPAHITVTDAQLEQRMQDGTCAICGKADHQWRECSDVRPGQSTSPSGQHRDQSPKGDRPRSGART